MRNSRIILLLIFSSILIFSLNSFKKKARQDCSAAYIQQWNRIVNAKRASLRGALPNYENCVSRYQNNVRGEELLINAYSVLGQYYLDMKDYKRAGYYRTMEARETMK